MRAAFVVFPICAGCSELVVEGVLHDGAGVPLEGAQVSLSGAPCQGLTNADGRFAFTCEPGVYTVNLEKPGYVPATLNDRTLARGERNDLGAHRLIEIPKEKGLFRIEGGVAHPLEPGRIVRTMGGSGVDAFKHYCLPPDSPAGAPVAAGALQLIDHGAPPWRAFRLDEEGCAYKISPSSADRWDVDFSDNPDLNERSIGADAKLVTVTLDGGRLFLADWNKGFFTRIESTEEGREGYSGYLLDVVDAPATASAP